MARYYVTTVQDEYWTYNLEANSPVEARRKVELALSEGWREGSDDILNSAVATGQGDFEEVIDVEL